MLRIPQGLIFCTLKCFKFKLFNVICRNATYHRVLLKIRCTTKNLSYRPNFEEYIEFSA